ncbi:MAG: hypothetical protein ACRDV0_05710, partial [Acidimicrobiales bacterium]
MNPSPPRRPSTSPWRLRATLALALVTLIAVGLTLRQHERGAEAGSTTTTTATTTTTPTVTTSTTAGVTTTTVGSVTTTTAPSHGTGPVVNVGSIDETARGCGFVARRAGQPITTTTVRHVTGLGHCTVLEIGDSLGNDLGWGLNRELESTPGLRLIQEDISSTGLCATWFYSWPHHLALDLARYHPNLVLVFIGANDEQGLRVHGASAVFSSSAWDHAYLKRIHQI